MATTGYKYRFNPTSGGSHVCERKKQHKPGDVFVSCKPDLHIKFRGKFECLGECDYDDACKEGAAEKIEEEANASDLGQDVSGEFQRASANGLSVFKKGQWYSVYETEDPAEALNEKKLRKGAVQDWIDEYLGEEDDE